MAGNGNFLEHYELFGLGFTPDTSGDSGVVGISFASYGRERAVAVRSFGVLGRGDNLPESVVLDLQTNHCWDDRSFLKRSKAEREQGRNSVTHVWEGGQHVVFISAV